MVTQLSRTEVGTASIDAVDRFESALQGDLIQPGHPQFDEIRALYNGMIDKRPAFIARCRDVADVIATVAFARETGLPLAIRGGGHNGAGLASVDAGIMLDLSLMKGIHVDPAVRTVRVEPGCTSIMPPMPLDWLCRAAPLPALAWQASPWVGALVT